MRIALVSGDGLPVSGLLTIFRNVLDIGRQLGVIDGPVPVDFGYSWRPDKPGFFPAGNDAVGNPPWVLPSTFDVPADLEEWREELVFIRGAVASHPVLEPGVRSSVARCSARIAGLYSAYFRRWLEQHEIDWVFALNMTLSDATPVSWGLHNAVADRYAAGRPGGIVFWDHDLFRSCSIHDPDSGDRLYPAGPNELTPLPKRNAWTRWVVVSEALAAEARGYPTDAEPIVLGNVLPQLPPGGLGPQHELFMRQHKLTLERPLLLDPVRVFQVKGVEIALRLLAATKAAAIARGTPAPVLTVFGSLEEDPEYAKQMLGLTHTLGLEEDVRWLDGVPLSTYADAHGRWRLDEIDLLRVAQATGGGVVFTPGVPDVETVGLGPALAAVAGLPCAVTDYNAFDAVYQRAQRFSYVHVGPSAEMITAAGEELLELLARASTSESEWAVRSGVNRRIVEEQFPVRPWQELWANLAASCGQIASPLGTIDGSPHRHIAIPGPSQLIDG